MGGDDGELSPVTCFCWVSWGGGGRLRLLRDVMGNGYNSTAPLTIFDTLSASYPDDVRSCAIVVAKAVPLFPRRREVLCRRCRKRLSAILA